MRQRPTRYRESSGRYVRISHRQSVRLYFPLVPLTYRLYTAERSEQGGRTIPNVPRGQKGSLAAAGRLEPCQKSEGASAGSRALPRRPNEEYLGQMPVVVTHCCL